ncbi:hypothetical protein [Klebsiella variicola]|uniref:hypothetical protein n=1 Tax=Klebsiella variicola TaxID=244366 RepID=UPI002B05F9F8|nr:hypothetical protein [Klebsiella variicola]
MTDITELAPAMKAAAIDAKELAIIARYSKGRAAAEKFYALANPNNVIALVEALEAKDKQIADYAGRLNRLEKRCDHKGSVYWDGSGVKRCARCGFGIKVEAE